MGDYAILTDAALYYKADKMKSIDDHSAGVMVFEKKRLALMEETSSAACFAEDKVNNEPWPIYLLLPLTLRIQVLLCR